MQAWSISKPACGRSARVEQRAASRVDQPFEGPLRVAGERRKLADHRLTKSVPIEPEKPFRFTNRGRSTNKINALAECPVLDSLRSRSANEI
jgi:hypothetical protein